MLEETIQTNASSEVSSVPQTQSTNTQDNGISFSADDFAEELAQLSDNKEASVEDKIKIKYNGKDEEYNLDQIKELAQKGRNYDHVFQEKESLKNSEEMKILSEIAKSSGYKDTKEFIKSMKETLDNEEFNKRVEDLENQGYEKEQAKYVAELEREKARATESTKTEEGQDALVNDFSDLLEAYPETRDFKDFDSYPEEFKNMVNDGIKPLVAYSKYLVQKQKLDGEVALKNADAINRDSGSFKTGESDGKKDPFLEGLFSK